MLDIIEYLGAMLLLVVVFLLPAPVSCFLLFTGIRGLKKHAEGKKWTAIVRIIFGFAILYLYSWYLLDLFTHGFAWSD